MIIQQATDKRELKTVSLDADLVVVGGGMAGVCGAITAARAGVRVVLVQDRPVLGGNASSEVRLWVLGATSHMGNNNRWAREGGVIDELLVENLYRNPEGNPHILDALMLEWVTREANITLLLNTAVFEVEKRDSDTISGLRAFCPQNSTMYDLHSPLFCDASGDGIVGFLAGAAFRMGAESKEEFGEKFAPDREYGELLGHSIYFYSKDVGHPVKFVPPAFALKDITQIPRFRSIRAQDFGCRFWWFEYGGRMDTVHDTEAIKWELWKVVYGVWNYIKNSGQFPEAETMTLEWVGTIPGKRESRRFEGDYMLIQQDIVEQRRHADAVAFGGWSIDLHPADGVYSPRSGCNQWHAKGVYAIPYRCLYSRNIRNLFLAGRIISSSHVAFASTRVMATAAYAAQAVGMAAAICKRGKLLPRDLAAVPHIGELQRELMLAGQHIPELRLHDPADLARSANITASSHLKLDKLPADGPLVSLENSWAMLLPVTAGAMPEVTFTVDAAEPTSLQMELRGSFRPDNHTPDVTLAVETIHLPAGAKQTVAVKFDVTLERPQYVFVCLMANQKVSVHASRQRLTGVLSVCNRFNPAVAKSSCQTPTEDIGVDRFEFWCPARRPGGHNLAMTINPPLDVYAPANLVNGLSRPASQPNAWVASIHDAAPAVTLEWTKPQTVSRIELTFDADWDHPAESVLMGHPEREMPFCVKHYRIRDDRGNVLHECTDNHMTRNSIRLARPVVTKKLTIECLGSHGATPAAIFEIRCY